MLKPRLHEFPKRSGLIAYNTTSPDIDASRTFPNSDQVGIVLSDSGSLRSIEGTFSRIL